MTKSIPTFEEVMKFTNGVSSATAFDDAECKLLYDTLISLSNYSNILEIGCQFGRSSSIIGQLQKAKKFYCTFVDPFTDPPNAAGMWLDMMQRTDAEFTLACMKSEDLYTPDDERIVLALVDGDHSDKGVRTDCNILMDRIALRGYLCFHDYGRDSLPDVSKVVNELIVAPNWVFVDYRGTLAVFRKVK